MAMGGERAAATATGGERAAVTTTGGERATMTAGRSGGEREAAAMIGGATVTIGLDNARVSRTHIAFILKAKNPIGASLISVGYLPIKGIRCVRCGDGGSCGGSVLARMKNRRRRP
uniref:Uncharacterized protein n=1 Tax=Oryza punctata TaxID=4537 RepID=A0A0E0M860_ORYPU